MIQSAEEKTQVVHISMLKLCLVGKNIQQGNCCLKQNDNMSDFSEAETILIWYSEDEDNCSAYQEARKTYRPHMAESANVSEWSSEDELPLGKLKALKDSPEFDAEYYIPLAHLLRQLKVQQKPQVTLE
jgi:hypothetical protein